VVSRSVVVSAAREGPPTQLAAEFGSRSQEVRSSTLHGLYLDTKSQRELFDRMDIDRSGTVSLDEIKNVLLKKTARYDRPVLTGRNTIAGRALHESTYSAGNVLSPIDMCGVPLGDDDVHKFLARKCRQHGNRMTFDEFSIMLLELARR
jgi:hypothetical protein